MWLASKIQLWLVCFFCCCHLDGEVEGKRESEGGREGEKRERYREGWRGEERDR